MDNFRKDFASRTDEIYYYLSLIEFLDKAGNEINSKEDPKCFFVITPEIRKTLKGSVYLIIYNLIEAAMRESINYIHETIHSQMIDFDELNISLQKEIIKRVKTDSTNIEAILSGKHKCLATDISMTTFNKKKLFSGNIDRDEINNKSKIYGFSTDTNYQATKHGEALKQIKIYRNDLAHGNVSFSEIGRDKTYQDLENICLETIAYLEKITENIEEYIKKKVYLHSAQDVL